MKIKNRTTLLRLLERLRVDPNLGLKLLRGGEIQLPPLYKERGGV